jgi:hypothetical protein
VRWVCDCNAALVANCVYSCWLLGSLRSHRTTPVRHPWLQYDILIEETWLTCDACSLLWTLRLYSDGAWQHVWLWRLGGGCEESAKIAALERSRRPGCHPQVRYFTWTSTGVLAHSTPPLRSIQLPSGAHAGSTTSGGDREFIPTIARMAAAVGVDGFFFETHLDPTQALCDAATMLPIDELQPLLKELMAISRASKALS